MKLSSILKGTRIAYDAIQSIQGLTIVPLTCDKEFSLDDKYASPFAHNVSTSSYGTVNLHPLPGESKTVLVTPHSTYITRGYSAQDHLISKATLLKRKSKTLTDSRCVESSQAGLLSSTRDNELVIAPLDLREIAYNYVGQTGYDKLWNDISNFNNKHGAGTKAQIKDYFTKWNKELDEFIAHFERIDNCIGFITLYEDEVVAIDKFPSFTYTGEIWEKLVRDSYGSLVIKDRVSKTPVGSALAKVGDQDSRISIEDVYANLLSNRNDHYKSILEEVVDIDFTTKSDTDTKGSHILKDAGYIGQIIEDNGVNVLVSIIKKASFKAKDMRKAREMRRIARKQDEFKL